MNSDAVRVIGVQVAATIKFAFVTCCDCGLVFGVELTWHRRLLSDGKTFYCPSGHAQCYAKTPSRKEDGHGATWALCPLCDRFVENIARHVRLNHPNYFAAEPGNGP